MHINPGLRVLRRSPSSMQIGLDEGLVLDGLTDGDCAVIAGLRTDRDDAALVALARRHRVERARVADLLAALAPVLLPSPEGASGLRADRLTGELGQLRAVHHREAPAVLGRRGSAVVRVHGTGALATAVLTGLAAAGIGRLVHDDGPPVSAAEIGSGGVGLAQLGLERRVAVRQAVRAVAPDAAIECVLPRDGRETGRAAGSPDLVVMTAADALPASFIAAAASERAVLPVVTRERDHVVGPLVVPGVTACLRCKDRHCTDADPAWPAIRDQLAVANAGPAPATSFVPALAALAVVQALAFLDGEHRPASWSAELVLRVADGRVGRRPCRPHPACPCAWAPTPDDGQNADAPRGDGQSNPGTLVAAPADMPADRPLSDPAAASRPGQEAARTSITA
ncbi:hypothetical protein V6N00_15285 [Tersicoccus sp. MR15.9]|uniref:hypothetical protein n=1 Tax=Tersicoccus mangrovi TaxID=3121635 RepID=UPI002FE60386